jgi:exopolyphosphatase / guanosine-5'-triphosphate,3'-diphosphate pyrophosphatase
VRVTEVGGLLGLALTDDHQTHPGVLEPLMVAVQLHRVVAAERSAVVAEKNQHGWVLRPDVSQPYRAALQVGYLEIGELASVAGRIGPLLVLRRSEHMGHATPVASQRIAVVDLGTNTTRLLVGDVADGAVEQLERDSRITRLGQGVDAAGRLADEAMDRVFDTLGDYRQTIDRLEPARVVGIATSAVRDAANGDEFRDELSRRFGVEARIIPGEEEARLTFLGATGGRTELEPPVMVLDIGGGSTEVVVGEPGAEPDFHVSTRLGSVRQTERHLQDDPPTEDQLSALSGEVAQTLADELPESVRSGVSTGIAVAGTATSLAAIDQELEPYDPERVHGYSLRLERCEEILGLLASLPLERRRKVRGLHPERAPTIVAGGAILVESMRAFGLQGMEASEADLLEGAALEVAGRG